MELILRKSSGIKGKPWALQIRDHGPVETDYSHVAYLTNTVVYEMSRCSNRPKFLFGEPDWIEIFKQERIEKLEEELKQLKS